MTPLHSAASNGRMHMMQYLCKQGADKDARTVNGRTPLHDAAGNGHLLWCSTCASRGVKHCTALMSAKDSTQRSDRAAPNGSVHTFTTCILG